MIAPIAVIELRWSIYYYIIYVYIFSSSYVDTDYMTRPVGKSSDKSQNSCGETSQEARLFACGNPCFTILSFCMFDQYRL